MTKEKLMEMGLTEEQATRKFDADAEYLDEDMDFTFEDFDMPETFSVLAGMQ